MSITVYAIPNCDTVKKARSWLSERRIEYLFWDYKKVGVEGERVAAWISQAGADKVLNRAGTTFKKLPNEAKADLNGDRMVALLVKHPSAIKRPIVEYPGGLLVGFKATEWETVFG